MRTTGRGWLAYSRVVPTSSFARKALWSSVSLPSARKTALAPVTSQAPLGYHPAYTVLSRLGASCRQG